MGRKTIKRGVGKQHIEGKDLRLTEEIQYIQRRAAEYDGRFVTVGPLALFSTDTGDAWLLDAEDHLAARLARDGDPENIHFEETDTRFAIGWTGKYRIDGEAFVYMDKDSGRVYHPGISRPPDHRMGLIGKFQICLDRIHRTLSTALF